MKTVLQYLLFVLIITELSISCSKDDSTMEPKHPYNGKTTAEFNPDVQYGTLTDIDGNIYRTVTIGTQTWMAENLRTSRLNDGTKLTHAVTFNDWKYANSATFGMYNNYTNADTIATYGYFYNWKAVETGKLAPEGWHVPTKAEWDILINSIGGYNTLGAYYKLLEKGILHWPSPNSAATNQTGFTAIPSGRRYIDGQDVKMGEEARYWTSTITDPDFSTGWITEIILTSTYIASGDNSTEAGLSVRCIKD